MNGKKLWAALLSLALCLGALTACDGGAASGGNGDAPKAPKPSENAVTVSDMESFLDAIKPGAEIVIAKGDYNLSEYANALWEMDEAMEWNDQHEYVQIRDCYDGAEVAIRNVDGLSISGSGATAATEIVIEPRYGTVLTFEKCDDLKLSNLTMGHTEAGECSGSVVELSACQNAELRDLDLYGCGVIALECSNGTEDVFVYDSALRDCSWGPLDVYGAVGKVELRNCYLTGSEGGGFFNADSRVQLAFYNCTFGEKETDFWAFTDAVKEDCTWAEVTAYPDYEEDSDYVADGEGPAPQALPENLQPLTFDKEAHTNSWWLGFSAVNAETGEAVGIPSGMEASRVTMTLRSDGTGVLNYYYGESETPFLWEQTNAATLTLTTPHDGVMEANLYQSDSQYEGSMWLSVRIGDALLWMY
jgi:hypothetical protein